MRKLTYTLTLSLLLLLAACGGSDTPAADGGEPAPAADPVELPTLASEVEPSLDGTPEPGEDNEDSPRADAGNGLPPTYTPQPDSAGEHSFVVEISQEDIDEGSVGGQPVVVEEGTADEDATTYTVVSGDTLAEIAAEFGVTLDSLFDANDDILDNIDEIEVGQVLVIPTE